MVSLIETGPPVTAPVEIAPVAASVPEFGPSNIVTLPVPALTVPRAMLPEVVLVAEIAPLLVAVRFAPPRMPLTAERLMALVALPLLTVGVVSPLKSIDPLGAET